MFEKIFQLKRHHTSIKIEVLAGATTFMTMAYILAVNPDLLAKTGMDKNALFTATALSSAIATLVMSLGAKLPFALAPGMGLNAFFAFTVVLGMGYSWQFALTAVFIEGLIFLILTIFNVREAIVNSIPINIKHAISTGIGLFIAFIGLSNAGIIVNDPTTLVTIGEMGDAGVIVSLLGLLSMGVMLAFRIKGALLFGIVISTIVGFPLGITQLPEGNWVDAPPSLMPIMGKFNFSDVLSFDMLIVLITFLFIDMFDTVGTLVGVCSKANMLDKDGNIPKAKKALFADAIGTTVGAFLGTSTVTTYVESASGVAEGGRTGLTSFTVAMLFLVALFFAPIFIMIPSVATAPALIVVGLFMMSPIKKIDFDDFTESIPAFLAIIIMPLAYSISEGIAAGMVAYVLLKILTGRFSDLSILMIILALFFMLKFAVG
jgi:AGZA family xanthine/uracil permease-like MFS transporter